MEAERAPSTDGVKVTEIVQLAPTARLAPQVFVWPKSDALVPVTAMLVKLAAAVPWFDSVTVPAVLVVPRFWFPNVRLEGLSETCATPTPVPVRSAV